MKKVLYVLIALALIISLSGCGGTGDETGTLTTTSTPAETRPATETTTAPAVTTIEPEYVSFTDPAFEDKVRECMGRADGNITVEEAAAVTELNLSMSGNDWSIPRISDLNDLKYFPNLALLSMNWALSKPGGVDLSPLAQLEKLEYLYLACTAIKDITPLEGLTTLKDIWLWGIRTIEDISPLAGMTELENLSIRDNLISDISPLSGLKKLVSLEIGDNVISDVSPLAGLSNLAYLKLAGNPVKDYTPLADIFPKLEEKDFELLDHSLPITFTDPALEKRVRESMGIPEGDITPEMSESVIVLCLGNSYGAVIPDEEIIRDIRSLRYFPNLSKLELQFNAIQENYSYLSVLRVMDNLTILDLNGNRLRGYDELAVCKSLKDLNISGNEGGNLTPLAELAALQKLVISHCPNARNIAPLASLANLEELFMENVNVDDFTPLANLDNLKTLYISRSEDYFPDLSPLADIYPNLTDKNFEMD